MWKVIIEYVNEQGNSIVDTVASGIKEKSHAEWIANIFLDFYSIDDVNVEYYTL